MNKIFTQNDYVEGKLDDVEDPNRYISRSRMKIDYKEVEKDLKAQIDQNTSKKNMEK